MRLFLLLYILGAVITAIPASIYATARLLDKGRPPSYETRLDGMLTGLLVAALWPVSVPFFALFRSVGRTLSDEEDEGA